MGVDLYETPQEHDPNYVAIRSTDEPLTLEAGYTYYEDYYGRRWVCCVCMAEWLPWYEKYLLFKRLIKTCIDVWQLTGNADASAGTHSKGGAGDLLNQITDAHIAAAREMGAPAAWRRVVAQGFSKDHSHFVLTGCPHNSPAFYQITAQRNGYNGLGYLGRGGPDPHPDPKVYRTWRQGIEFAKREMGLLATATTTEVLVSPNPSLRRDDTAVSVITKPAAPGRHKVEYWNGSAWLSFKDVATTGSTHFDHRFGGVHPIRATFTPTDATKYARSVSPEVDVTSVDLNQVLSDIDDLQARVTKLEQADPPKPVPAFGVDVSGHQSVEQVRAAAADPNIEFIFVKATQGTTYVTNSWKAGYQDLAGSKYIGPYHYAEPPQSPIAEMDHFLATVGDIEGKILMVDQEFWDGEANRREEMTPEEEAQLATCVLDACLYLRSKAGGIPLVYTNWLWVPRFRRGCTLGQWDQLVEFPCFLAQNRPPGEHDTIDPKPGSTKGWPVLVHQYAVEDYVGGRIDRDWTPDISALRALAVGGAA